MNFNPTAEQEQIKKSLQEYLQSEGGIDLARRQLKGDKDIIDDVWDDLAAMDYTAITVPFDYGGFDEDIEYLSFVLEELGKFAVPGPYLETLAFCTPLLRHGASDEQKEAYFEPIASGDHRMSFALYEDYEQSLPAGVELAVSETANGYRLDGSKVLVPYVESVDSLLVAGRLDTEDNSLEFFLVDAADADITPCDSLDKTRPMYEVSFTDVTVPEERRVSGDVDGGSLLSAASARYNTALCAMLVGAADRTVDLSVKQGNTREQFGHPVGRFQGVKHRTADMWMDMEQCRSLVYRAAWALSNDQPEASVAVSAAKSRCIESCSEIFGADIQNHGGTGFTSDHDTHIYLKQARAWEHFLGSPHDHREQIALHQNI